MKTCREVRSRILPAVDGSLPIETVFEVEEHVRGCADCRARYEEARALDAALSRLLEPPVERIDLDRAVAGVRAAIDRERDPVAPETPVARRSPWLPIVVGTVAAAVALIFGLWRSPSPAVPTEPRGSPQVAVEPSPRPEGAEDPPEGSEHSPETAENHLDPFRLAHVRAEVRCLLALAAERLPPAGDPASASALAARFDEDARDLDQEGWPLRRLVEGAIGDPDATVARAAARYLGVRGDRLSLRALETALARAEIAADAALALCDAGEAALDGLALAVREPRARAIVLARLSDRRDESSARFIETCLRDTAGARTSRGGSARLLEETDALARMGPAAVPCFLRLGSDGSLTRDEAIDALARTEGAPALVADRILAPQRGVDDSLVLRSLAALQPPGALPRLERRCMEQRELRSEALECIAFYGGDEGLAVLSRLAASGRIPRSEIEEPIQSTLAGDRDAGRAVVEACTREDRRFELAVLQEILAADPRPDCGPAFVALGGCGLLPSSDRRWSVLLAGETGAPADAEALCDLFSRLRPAEKEIRAACLIAIRSLSGIARVERLLDALPPRIATRVLALLDARDAKDRPASTLSRLARELDGAIGSFAP